jgi:Domain of unknown function (DUF4202)
MRGVSARYAAATAAIDAANDADPQYVRIRGANQPLAFAHGLLAVEWVQYLDPDADELLLLAARAHHLRRWELPRSAYPDGRVGYLRWRKDQKIRHATEIEQILTPAGYSSLEIRRVQELIRRDRLATDPGAQAVEDAACLVFIETQLQSMESKLDHDHLVEVLRKSARKMSPAGIAAVSTIQLGPDERALLSEALG